MAGQVHVTGLSDLARFLDELPEKLARNVLRSALRAGAVVLRDEAKAGAPVGQPSGENRRIYGGYAGALRDSIRVGTRRRGNTVMSYVRAGGKSARTKADVYYAHMVEFGTATHLIAAKKGGFLVLGQGIYAKVVRHPGAKAKPFMRRALDSRASQAVVATAEAMKARLQTKHGLDTADVNIQG